MSSAEDQLLVNISSGLSSSSRKRGTARQRWATKWRRSSSGQHTHLNNQGLQVPPPDVADRKPEKEKKKKKETDRGKETGRSGIKTSSLFNHNPDIPELQRPVVSQVTETIFTADSFSDLQLHPHLVATLNKVLNVSTLTSVQKQTIPVLLSGRDGVVRSQTGSGKTLSYAVPVVQSLQSVQPKVSRSDGPLAVVIVPTREVAEQVFFLLQPFTWIVPGVLMGGEKRKAEKARLRKGINILVSTPGRLVDHIKHTLSIAFSAVRWLILDEADRTLDLGFEKDLTIILNSLNSAGPRRQNVLLSATLTHGVIQLAHMCLNDPVSIHVSDPASSTLACFPTSDPSPASQSESYAVPEGLKQYVVVVPSKIRLVCLAAFILDKCKFSQNNKLIVFVSSCEVVEFLHTLFTAVLSGPSTNHKPPLSFLRLHGNMKQEMRCVFQDVAARGLDLPQVTWIVQYTPPSAAAEYVHRVGRTARIGGRGSSLLFLTPAETTFIEELANHNISVSEMKVLDILSSLMMDDTYKGRGKYHSKSSFTALQQETRERAVVLQTHFEDFVHSGPESVQTAKKALQSFLRAYTTYPAHLKHIFHIRSLHLGHAAKSFGLRDAPQGLSAASRAHGTKQARGTKRKEVGLLRSEFSSGLDGAKKKKKKKKALSESGEED
uniref:ATP-dependent RNA helicase n=1 Tax=Mastacembelus armatus TaxID=205130 RepID=A0A7N8XS64_9TELE